MRPNDERLLLRLWADMWRDDFAVVVARSRAPVGTVLQDVAYVYRSRVRARLLAGEFEGEDHAYLRRCLSGGDPEIVVEPRWIEPPAATTPSLHRDGQLDVALVCRALQHRRWHIRQPWTTQPTTPSPQIRGARYDGWTVDDADIRRHRAAQVGRWRADYDGEHAYFQTQREAQERLERLWTIHGPPRGDSGVYPTTQTSRRTAEIEARLTQLQRSRERELYEGLPPTPGIERAIEDMQRRLAAATSMPVELLGYPDPRARTSDDRVDAAVYAYEHLKKSALEAFAGVAKTTDAPPRNQCRTCRAVIPNPWGVNSTCERCQSAQRAVERLVLIIQIVHAACGLGFAVGFSCLADLRCVVAGVRMDGLFAHATITYAGYSARRVGVCTVHGLQHQAATHTGLYCLRCHEESESRRLALALLARILDVALTAWRDALPAADARALLLETSPSTYTSDAPLADLHSARYGLLELGAPTPYEAPSDQSAALSSVVDEAYGVRNLLLEME